MYPIALIIIGLLMDGCDYLFYEPPGAIGFGRQRGLVGSIGLLLWLSGCIWLTIKIIVHVSIEL